MERIVLGLDDQQSGQSALDWVVERSAAHPVALTIVSVAASARAAERLRGIATAAAGRVRSAHPGSSVVVSVVTDGSAIAEALTLAARGADLLVIAHHRRRRLRAALAGWLPLDVLALAPCPVVVVPDDWIRRYGRIVVGVTSDGSSDRALQWAASEADRMGRLLDIVAVEPKEVSVGARMLVETSAGEVRAAHPGVVVQPIALAGDRDEALELRARDAAMVVLGSHGRQPVESVLVGAAVHELMGSVAVPICIVPATREKEWI